MAFCGNVVALALVTQFKDLDANVVSKNSASNLIVFNTGV